MLNFFRNHKKLSIFLILFFIGFVLYGNTFNNKFFWDDDDSIVNNVYIKNWDYFDKYFTENLIAGSGQVTDYWRPVLLISFALDYHLWGLDPFGFHFTNMLLHILCAWLIFLFLRDIVNLQQQFDGAQRECERESTRISASDTSMYRFQLSKEKSFILPFLVSLIFLIHPLQTEAVAYAAGRADPLSTIFVLLAVLMYLEWRAMPSLFQDFTGMPFRANSEQVERAEEGVEKSIFANPRDSSARPPQNFCGGLGRNNILGGDWADVWKRFLSWKNGYGKYFAALLFFIFGLLAKEQVILFPLLILLVETVFFVKKGRNQKKTSPCPLSRDKLGTGSQRRGNMRFWESAKNVLPFFVISAIYFIMRITVLNFKNLLRGFQYNIVYDNSAWFRFLTFSRVCLEYFKLLFAPLNLHMAREVEVVKFVFSLPVICFLLIIGAIIYTCILTWKKDKLITFGFLWFAIILLPRANIFQINRPMYEHWLYLPMVGFWLAILCIIWIIYKKIALKNIELAKPLFYIGFLIFSILMLWLCALTMKRNKDWQNPITFYEKNLKFTPNSFIQHNNLGMAYADAGREKEAVIEYQKAIEISDEYAQVHHNLANSLVSLGEIDQAIFEYEKAIKMSPEFILPYNNLAKIYLERGEKDKLGEILNRMEMLFNK